ncbi:unnamed protein product [Cylindrotheca closterium]|uniref:Uncharacterized protein n=1 Tax=Cylindrotheca closterium TaxID=2856 RepID=A0AAD2CUV7_9STRA|nr:unnamed protein product [Cylindrotheca closterium]
MYGSVLNPGRSGVVIGGSPAGLSLLSDISSITQLSPAAESVSSSVPTDSPEELVDSDHEDALDLDEPDNHNIETEEDFQHLDCEAEEAQLEQMLQLCVVGKPKGSKDHQSIKKKDLILNLMDLEPDVKIAGLPAGHKDPAPEPRVATGEIPFDTQRNWPHVIYRGKVDKSRKYQGHELPAGAKCCPSMNGQRTCNGWEFHYGPWEHNHEEAGTNAF